MIKAREDLNVELYRYFSRIALHKKTQDKIVEYCKQVYGLPEKQCRDYLYGQKEISSADNGLALVFADAADNVRSGSKLVKEYFTEAEVQLVRQTDFAEKKLTFPLRYKMLPVEDGQWIGAFTIDDLMDLWNAQLINYNANTQRVLRVTFRKGVKLYRPYIDQGAIASIRESFHEGRYIPNTLTFNIPENDESADFYYNEKTCELVINNMKGFDILDGYHRLVAITQERAENEDFHYAMEIRIVNWNEDKAQRFIYQEDQKTKMRLVDSNAYNTATYENRVVAKLNENRRCNMMGMIGLNHGLINAGWLGKALEWLFFHRVGKIEGQSRMLPVQNVMVQSINGLTESYQEYLTREWKYDEVLTVCYIAWMLWSGELSQDDNLGEIIYMTIQKVKDINDRRIHTPGIPLSNKVFQLIKDVM